MMPGRVQCWPRSASAVIDCSAPVARAEVFALDHERVLRLYRRRHEAPEQTADQLRALYQAWQHVDIGIEVPMIIEMR